MLLCVKRVQILTRLPACTGPSSVGHGAIRPPMRRFSHTLVTRRAGPSEVLVRCAMSKFGSAPTSPDKFAGRGDVL